MKKTKLFIENFLVYGFGGVMNKIIPFFMIPILTRLMPDSTYFGISDMSNTIISFASAIAVMGMYDAMYRLFFESDDIVYKRTVCSTTVVFTFFMSLCVFIILVIFRGWISNFFFGDVVYSNIIIICAVTTFASATNSIVAAPTRMENKRKVFLLTNTLSPILSYSISIVLILQGHYLIAIPISATIAGLSMELIFFLLNHSWFIPVTFDKKLFVSLLKIAIPVMPGFLIYWVFNSSDKVMITNLMSIADAGIYSVGSKLGHASQLIYSAFAGGWQYFAFSTMREKNQVKSNSNIFEFLGAISFVATMFVCGWSHFIYKLLFVGDYVDGFIIAPYLFLAPLLQMLFQVASNQFLVVKKAWPVMLILSSGAIINILLNFTIIPIIGIEGAAISTLIGYIVTVFVCAIVLCKMKLMVVTSRFLYISVLMSGYFIIWRVFLYQNSIGGTILAVIGSSLVVIRYIPELKYTIVKLREKNKD